MCSSAQPEEGRGRGVERGKEEEPVGAADPSRLASNPDPRGSVGNTLRSWVPVVATRVLYLTVPLSALPRDGAVHHTAECGGQKRDLVAKPSPCQRLPHIRVLQ